MRKNNGGGKKLKKLYFTTYSVVGLNAEGLLNKLKKNGVTLYDVKKTGRKKIIVTVNGYDNEKFFAIADEMCYNVKKLKDKGFFYPLLYAFRNVGTVIGLCVFIAVATFFNDRIFTFSFIGTGSVYRREITDFLNEKGIVTMSKFSDIDFRSLEDEILSSNAHLSFVSCVKNGNRLQINTALATDGRDVLSGSVDGVFSDSDGVVETVKAYRGTAVVKAGDIVRAGDLLVDGIVTIGDNVIKTNVIASVTIIVSDTVVYKSEKDGEDDYALVYARENTDKDCFEEFLEKTFDGKEYIYTVTLKSRRTIKAG